MARKLPVGDQPLEHAPGKVVQSGSPQARQIAGRQSEAVENGIRRAGGDRQEQVGGNAEYRIVVDVSEDMLPTLEQTTFADVVEPGNTQLVDGFDAMRFNNRGVEDEGVGDDGHGHARGLLAVLLMQGLCHVLQRMGAGCLAQLAGGLTDTLLQNLRSLDEQPLGQRDVFNATGEIVNVTGEPARGPANAQPYPPLAANRCSS